GSRVRRTSSCAGRPARTSRRTSWLCRGRVFPRLRFSGKSERCSWVILSQKRPTAASASEFGTRRRGQRIGDVLRRLSLKQLGRDVRAVVIEEITLNLRLPRRVQKGVLIGPKIRVIELDLRIGSNMARLRGCERHQVVAQRLFMSSPVRPKWPPC